MRHSSSAPAGMSNRRPVRWLGERVLGLVLLSGGCAGPARPAVMTNLRYLPADTQRQGEILDSAQARPEAEDQQRVSEKERELVTAAATAAAILGVLFSTSPNASLGVATPMEENRLFDASPAPAEGGRASDAAADEGAFEAGTSVPWLRFPKKERQ